MSDVLLSERRSPQIHLLTLNRPEQLNAMSAELCQALHDELAALAADRSCRVIVLTGSGRGFCAGVDLRGYGQAPGNDGSDAARDHFANQEHMSTPDPAPAPTPQPVIAAVNGPAAGFGLALALGSDIRYAARSAVFRAAFVNIGLSNCDMGVELAAAEADRRLPRPRADADRPQGRRRGGERDRPGRRRRRGRGAAGALAGGRGADRRLGAVGHPPHEAGDVERPGDLLGGRGDRATRTASRSWPCTAPRPPRRSRPSWRSAKRSSRTERGGLGPAHRRLPLRQGAVRGLRAVARSGVLPLPPLPAAHRHRLLGQRAGGAGQLPGDRWGGLAGRIQARGRLGEVTSAASAAPTSTGRARRTRRRSASASARSTATPG